MKRVRVFLSAALLTLPIAGLARAPGYSAPGADDAALRFSWRMTVPATEDCRPRSQEELESLPVHMRSPEVCTRDESDFMIVLAVDGSVADTLHLVRGGFKGDRPLIVLEERNLEPGRHSIQLQLIRAAANGSTILAALDTTLLLGPGDVGLVTLDADAGRLHARTPYRP
ncbi:MAG TPA: hypothetical protein VK929_00530 [Longimicrobiales bacterium]|nr:hypothetical protein [Longimicrobiales bacterium]